MDIFSGFLKNIAEPVSMEPGDYVENGLIHCGQCHTPRERVDTFAGKTLKHSCECQCRTARRNAEREARQQREEFEKFSRYKETAFNDESLRQATFEAADGKNRETLEKLERYADNFTAVKEKNIGLCLIGDVGTGKSYGAACVVNRLLERGIPAMMTNLPRIANELFTAENKNDVLNRLTKPQLLVLDDFGVERNTEYAMEQVYQVIDSRYRAARPLIITTNLSWNDLKNPSDTAHSRIYDRIVEMCQAISFGTDGRRSGIAADKRKAAKDILLG